MADLIDLWNDLEDAERIFGLNSKEYREAVKEIKLNYPKESLD
jgi:hypothetical protein